MADEQFHDYTVATAFERLVAQIESCLTSWRDKDIGHLVLQQVQRKDQQGGSQLLTLQAQLQHRLPFRAEPYTLTLHLTPPVDLQQQQQQQQLEQPQPQQQQGCEQQQQHQQQHSPWNQTTQAPSTPGTARGSSSSVGRRLAALPAVTCGLQLHDAPHRLQHWFGAPAFLLLTPDSYSGRVLDEEEVHTLLSAAAVALSHVRIAWPLLLPVHDAVRDGYHGVAAAPGSGSTLKLDTDSLHSSRLPPGLLQLEQQLALFGRQLAAAGALAAAAACRAAAGVEPGAEAAPTSMAADAAAAGGSGSCGSTLQVAVAVRHSYALPGPGDEAEGEGSSGWEEEPLVGSSSSSEWDADAPWRPWAAEADPVGCLELDVVWRFPDAAAALQAHTGLGGMGAAPDGGSTALLPALATDWRLLALSTAYERDTGQRGFVLRPVDRPRRFLRLQSITGQRAQRILEGGTDVAPALLPAETSFYGMLLTLLESCKFAARAPALGSLASADWWLQQGAVLPPVPADWVLQEAVRDIFQMPVLPAWPGLAAAAIAWPTSTAGQHGCLGKAAPLGALISRFVLHALALGSPRAVAALWQRVVSTLRLAYWEPLRPLPRMRLGPQPQEQGRQQAGSHAREAAAAAGAADADAHAAGSGQAASAPNSGDGDGDGGGDGGCPPVPTLCHSLIHQKLQLIDLCIHLLRQPLPQQQHQELQAQQPQRQQQAQLDALDHSYSSPARQNQQQQQQGKHQHQHQHQPVLETAAPAAAADGWKGGGGAADGHPPVSPANSTSSDSSYYSAGGGSDAQASPAKTQAQSQPASPAAAGPPPKPAGAGKGAGAEPGATEAAALEAEGAGVTGAGAGGVTDDLPAELAGASAGAASAAPDAPDASSSDDGGRGVPHGAVGVLPGACLHLHPSSPLRVPAVQEPPVVTEDLLAERQAALQALPQRGADMAALRSSLEGRMLLSDMQAFKAANPGCCFLDFVRWHSPKDCCPGEDGSGCRLSARMAEEGNAWQQLWAAAAPVPARQQRPLFDPRLEGERALHFLETLPPPALFSELLALGFSAAVQVLVAAAEGPAVGAEVAGRPMAALPAVRRQLDCLAAAAGPELAQGVALAHAAAERQGSTNSSSTSGVGGTALEATGAAAAAAVHDQEWEEGNDPYTAGGSLGADRGDSSAVAGGSSGCGDGNGSGDGAGSSNRGGRSGTPEQPDASLLHSLFDRGLSSSRYRRLLLLLGCTEQAVVAAHSLLLRLAPPPPPPHSQQQSPQQSPQQLRQWQAWRGVQGSSDGGAEHSDGSSSTSSSSQFASSVADALIAAALGERQQQQQMVVASAQQQQPAAEAAAVDLAVTQWPQAKTLLELPQQQRRRQQEGAMQPESGRGIASSAAGFPAPFQQEWLLQVHSRNATSCTSDDSSSAEHPDAAADDIAPPGAGLEMGVGGSAAPLQRMYVRALPAEVRIATAISSEF